ncbi:MAG: cation-transporting P-type ATPase [Lactobacillus gasseri]
MLKMFKINTSGTRNTTDTKLVRRIACEDKFATLQRLKTSISGLQSKDARQRLAKYGSNEIIIKHDKTKLHYLLKAFITPFSLVLLFLAIVAILFISAILTAMQNIRINTNIQNLINRISRTTQVMRDCEPQQLLTRDLTIGDVVLLKAGDIVPADVKLLKSNDLECSLLGEEDTVKKSATNYTGKNNNLDYANILYAGTIILSGSGIGVIFATGKETVFGKVVQNLSKINLENHLFNFSMKKLTKIFLTLILVIVPVVLLINEIMRGNWENALIFAIAITIGITAEVMPTAIVNNLVKANIDMPRIRATYDN